MPCIHGKGYVRGDAIETEVSETIGELRLPKSWRELVLELLSSREEVEAIRKEQIRLQEKLRRLKRQYREVEIDEDEYRRELDLTQARLAGLVLPEEHEVVRLGDHVEGIPSAWRHATKEERRDMLRLMLEAIYVDLDTKQMVGVRPKPSFLPLFNLKEPVEAGEMLLTTRLTPSGLDSGRGRQTELNSAHYMGCRAPLVRIQSPRPFLSPWWATT